MIDGDVMVVMSQTDGCLSTLYRSISTSFAAFALANLAALGATARPFRRSPSGARCDRREGWTLKPGTVMS